MATTKVLGKVSLTLGGNYSDAVSYSRLTMVLAADGKGYVSKQDNTVGIEPAVTAGWENYWQLVTERGAGITSIQKTASGETSDTYTIYYENGTTSTYQAENGKGYVADVTRSIGDDFSIMTGAYSVIDGTGWTNGKYLKNDGSISTVADMKVMALTAVPEGSYTLAIRATSPFASQAMRFCGYDGSGTFVRGLGNFAAPTAAGVLKATINTTGCAQIRIAAGLYDAVAVYAGESIIEKVSAIDTTLIDKAPAIMNTTESSPIASFPDGAAGLPMALTVGIEPVQAGSGDPSPTNVRPITGWTGCNVVRTGGKNLVDEASLVTTGITYSNGVLTGTASAFHTAYGPNGTAIAVPHERLTLSLEAYTDAESGSTGYGLSITVNYTDGTANSLRMPNATASFTAFALTTTAGKTPTSIGFTYSSIGSNTWHMRKLQVEAGTTATAYVPSTGSTTLPVAFPSSAGTVYGGTLRIERDGSGTLTVDHGTMTRKLSTFAVQETLTNTIHYRYASNFFDSLRPAHNQNGNVCSIAPSEYSQADKTHFYVGVSTGRVDLWVPTSTDTSTDVQIVITLATPLDPITLTPGQVLSILGENRVWADCGDTSVEYAADTKLFIETRIAELQALVLENIGG